MLDQIEPPFQQIASAFAGLGPVACELNAAAIIGAVVRETPKPAHPAKHLAILTAMFPNVEELIQQLASGGPVLDTDQSLGGSEDAPVSAAPHNDSIAQQDFLAAIAAGASVRVASTSAGVSTTTGVRWARQNGIEFIARPKTITATVLAQLRAELAQGEDRNTLAERHAISLTSVHRLLSTEHKLLELWRNARHEAARQQHRQTIREVIAAKPGCTAKQIRVAAPASWVWLYRHDRTWLTDSLPSLWTAAQDQAQSH